jgi:hypothetical protein
VNPGYRIHKYNSVGNLHISLFGEFNGMCAWALLKIIKRQNAGHGRVFVNTAGIGKILPAAVVLFKDHMPQQSVPSDWLYFKGEKGFQIAPDGSRVLICKKDSNRRRPNLKNPNETIGIYSRC